MAFDRFFSLFVTIRFNIIILFNVQTLKIHWKNINVDKNGTKYCYSQSPFQDRFFFSGKNKLQCLVDKWTKQRFPIFPYRVGPLIPRHLVRNLLNSCSVKTHTYEPSLGWKLDSCLICKSAQDHVFLKEKAIDCSFILICFKIKKQKMNSFFWNSTLFNCIKCCTNSIFERSTFSENGTQ